jgi:catechol 2,3-dioxygenase-like lactoylglutathione lyase family enzyme
MKPPKNIDVLFVAGFGPIVCDPAASRKFYSETLGLPFKEDANGYLYTAGLDGVKHFALWPLAQAAESCFGTAQWPGDLRLFSLIFSLLLNRTIFAPFRL